MHYRTNSNIRYSIVETSSTLRYQATFNRLTRNSFWNPGRNLWSYSRREKPEEVLERIPVEFCDEIPEEFSEMMFGGIPRILGVTSRGIQRRNCEEVSWGIHGKKNLWRIFWSYLCWDCLWKVCLNTRKNSRGKLWRIPGRFSVEIPEKMTRIDPADPFGTLEGILPERFLEEFLKKSLKILDNLE